MRKDHDVPAGTVHSLWLDSQSLRDNLLGDPCRRRIDVYVPAGHDGRGLPLLVDLVGYTAGGPAHTNWKNYGENVPERLDRLIGTGAMHPVAVAFPDCFTRLGGNQYVDSAAMGPWETFLIREMLPFVEERFGCGGDGRRGVFGKSSGGYGAMVYALRHGGSVWSAAASHSGDVGFEYLYHLGEFAGALRHLVDHNMSIEAFLRKFEAGPKAKDKDWHVLMLLAQAASFDPDPSQFYGVRLPVDLQTCEIIEERWSNWLRWDPLRMVDQGEHQANLRKLKAFFIDCGDIDQYNMVYGSRIMHRKLEAAGIPHTYQEFHDDHSSVDYRMDISLPLLAKALS
ncbi:enterochelin esterase [Microvirga sp. 3-52]|uniref:alpha/beta hydrolase n=1 Tax=Microvirga sp. 3-52 TaxID=2792425 RepID=UPI001ACBAE2F|nr:alpha/beta hydrolase-fold protein [Microvirga sp. 3-52]MBO1907311.1 enterochelin esterase [Microvirga sp. 3-52]MBS7454265.1 enterochelin esterase [Microvirga sp. 3-52]